MPFSLMVADEFDDEAQPAEKEEKILTEEEIAKLRTMKYYPILLWDLAPIALMPLLVYQCSTREGDEEDIECLESTSNAAMYLIPIWSLGTDGYVKASGGKMLVSVLFKAALFGLYAAMVDFGEGMHDLFCDVCDTPSCLESCQEEKNTNSIISYFSIVFLAQAIECGYHLATAYENNKLYKKYKLEGEGFITPYLKRDHIGIALGWRF